MERLLLKYRGRDKDDEKQTHRLKNVFQHYETHGVLTAAEHEPLQYYQKCQLPNCRVQFLIPVGASP